MNRNPEELKKYHVQRMGDKLGSFFNQLYNQVAQFYYKFNEYNELFGKNPLRVDLLNKAAPNFFYLVQKTMEDDMLLHISRLTDPLKSHRGKYEYFTINRLYTLIMEKELEGVDEKELDVKKKEAAKKNQPLKDHINEAINKAKHIREHRNKRIAHIENPSVSKNVKPPVKLIIADLRYAIEDIAAVLNYVASHYLGSTIDFNPIIKSDSAIDLLYVIDYGLKAEEVKRKRIEAGDYQPDDYNDNAPDWALPYPD
jgi:hypothetical protein